MKNVQLSNGNFALVDDEDFEYVTKRTFSRSKKMCWSKGSNGYARCYVHGWNGDGKAVIISMQNYLMEPPKGMMVDHINRNKLDNRKCNLRLCSKSQNIVNSKKRTKTKNTHRGVYETDNGLWLVRLQKDGKCIFYKTFCSKKEAIEAHKKIHHQIWGAFSPVKKT